MAWRRPGDKPLSEPMMVSLLTHLCVTRPQWVKVPLFLNKPSYRRVKLHVISGITRLVWRHRNGTLNPTNIKHGQQYNLEQHSDVSLHRAFTETATFELCGEIPATTAKKLAVRLRRLCKQGIGKSEIKSTLIHVYKYKDTMSVRIIQASIM